MQAATIQTSASAPTLHAAMAAPLARRYLTINECAEIRPFTAPALRDLKFKAHDRKNSRAEIIKGNGTGRAKVEVITRQLAIKTRLGGLNAGPDLWAVTWLPISDYAGLTEVTAKTYHLGAWHFLNPPVPVPKRDERTAGRNNAVPPAGTAEGFTVPPAGTKTALFSPVTVPPAGNNEVTSSPRQSSARRVVGKQGASGTKPRKTARVYRLVQPVGFTYAPKRKSA